MILKLIKFRENQFNDLETSNQYKINSFMIWQRVKYIEIQFDDLETNKIFRKTV